MIPHSCVANGYCVHYGAQRSGITDSTPTVVDNGKTVAYKIEFEHMDI